MRETKVKIDESEVDIDKNKAGMAEAGETGEGLA